MAKSLHGGGCVSDTTMTPCWYGLYFDGMTFPRRRGGSPSYSYSLRCIFILQTRFSSADCDHMADQSIPFSTRVTMMAHLAVCISGVFPSRASRIAFSACSCRLVKEPNGRDAGEALGVGECVYRCETFIDNDKPLHNDLNQ